MSSKLKKIKKILTPNLEIIVASDASTYDISAVNLHKHEVCSENGIAHASMILLSTEKNYSLLEKEALGKIVVVKKTRKDTYGRRYPLQTEYRLLLSSYGSKMDIPTYTAN